MAKPFGFAILVFLSSCTNVTNEAGTSGSGSGTSGNAESGTSQGPAATAQSGSSVAASSGTGHSGAATNAATASGSSFGSTTTASAGMGGGSTGVSSTSGTSGVAVCEAVTFDQQCSSDVSCGACSWWCTSAGCEAPCSLEVACPNAVTICGAGAAALASLDKGPTCGLNICDGGVGQPCDTVGLGQGSGTCVPQSSPSAAEAAVLYCVPNGTAAHCLQGANNDDPFFWRSSYKMDRSFIDPQPRDPSQFCGTGEACYVPWAASSLVDDGGGFCVGLCAPDGGGQACPATQVCQAQAPNDQTWGFCLPCLSSGSDGGAASSCLADSDCCEQNCQILPGDMLGSCVAG